MRDVKTTELGENMHKSIQRSISKTAMVVFTMLLAQTAIANDVLYCTSELTTQHSIINNTGGKGQFNLL